jgi:DNA polymerase sigma
MAPSDRLQLFESVRRRMEACLQETFSKKGQRVELHIYGSSSAELATASSDLDLSLNSPDHASQLKTAHDTRGQEKLKFAIVSTIAACLKQSGYVGIVQIAHARVPVVKLLDPGAGNSCTADGSISCDVCINNVLGVANSALLREYARCDERCRKLMLLVKASVDVVAHRVSVSESRGLSRALSCNGWRSHGCTREAL